MAVLEPFHLALVNGKDEVKVIDYNLKEINRLQCPFMIYKIFHLKDGRLAIFSFHNIEIILWNFLDNITSSLIMECCTIKHYQSSSNDCDGIFAIDQLWDGRVISFSRFGKILLIWNLQNNSYYRIILPEILDLFVNSIVQLSQDKIAFYYNRIIFVYDLVKNTYIELNHPECGKIDKIIALSSIQVVSFSVHNRAVRIWNITNNSCIILTGFHGTYDGGIEPIITLNKIIYSSDNNSIVCWEFDELINIRLENHECVDPLKLINGFHTFRNYSSCPDVITFGSPNDKYKMTQFKSFKEELNNELWLNIISLSDDRIISYIHSQDYSLRIWNTDNKTFVQTPISISDVRSVQEISKNRLLITNRDVYDFFHIWDYNKEGKIKKHTTSNTNKIIMGISNQKESIKEYCIPNTFDKVVEISNNRFLGICRCLLKEISSPYDTNHQLNLFDLEASFIEDPERPFMFNLKNVYKFHTIKDKKDFSDILHLPNCFPIELKLVMVEYLIPKSSMVFS